MAPDPLDDAALLDDAELPAGTELPAAAEVAPPVLVVADGVEDPQAASSRTAAAPSGTHARRPERNDTWTTAKTPR